MAEPKTPPRGENKSTANVNLTPLNSAANAEFRRDETIDPATDQALKDIQDHLQGCGFEDMVLALLKMAANRTELTEHSHTWAKNTLAECLILATSFINSWETCSLANNLREGLIEYCQAGTEQERYPGLTRALNSILFYFKIHNACLPTSLQREETKLDSIYMINDPSNIRSHRAGGSLRAPSVLKVKLDVLNGIHGANFLGDTLEAAFQEMLKRRTVKGQTVEEEEENRDLNWLSVLMCLELKKVTTLESNLVLASYTAEHLHPDEELDFLKVPTSPDSEDDDPVQILPPVKPMATKLVLTPEPGPSRRNPARNSGKETISDVGRKRQSGDSMLPAQKKVKLSTDSDTRKLHPTVQLALYATERLLSAPWITRTPGLIITDEKVHVWWYDREGAIQAKGLDFLRNLPHFVVLILLFQRLGDQNMGVAPEFRISPQGKAKVEIEGRQYSFDSEDMSNHYAFVGRGTTGVFVNDSTHWPQPNTSRRLFLKMSWPEAARDREADIIRRINKLADKEHNESIKNHIPTLVGARTFDDHSTSHVRQLFGLPTDHSRVFVCTVFEELRPLTTLLGLDLWKAYWQIIKTHYQLWQWGIRHGDISVSNLMINNNGCGVLNDYDYSLMVVNNSQHISGSDRTGTTPFLAVDLLTELEEANLGKADRLYRHELEAFMWVLVWISSCYDNGEETIPEGFWRWLSSDYMACAQAKSFLKEADIPITPSYHPIYDGVMALRNFWQHFDNELGAARAQIRRQRRSQQTGQEVQMLSIPEASDRDILSQLFNHVANDKYCKVTDLVLDLPFDVVQENASASSDPEY